MIASEVYGFAQQQCGEQNVGQRWTVAQWIAATDRAHKHLSRELKWPPSRFLFTSQPGVQEYQLQEVLKILDVYVNGQLLVQTDIATLQGEQIQISDQSGSAGGPGGLISPQAPPTLAGGPYSPAWAGQGAAAYPVANVQGTTLSASPWFVGQRPMYYCEGGNLGFVPPPLVAYPVVVRCIKQPALLQNPTDALVLPDICLDALAWKVCEYFYYANPQQDGNSDSRNYANAQYKEALIACKDWKRTYAGDTGHGVIPRTYRTDFTKGQRRNSGGWD